MGILGDCTKQVLQERGFAGVGLDIGNYWGKRVLQLGIGGSWGKDCEFERVRGSYRDLEMYRDWEL